MAVTTNYFVTTLQAEQRGSVNPDSGHAASEIIGRPNGGYALAYATYDATGGIGGSTAVFTRIGPGFEPPLGATGYGLLIGDPELVRLASGSEIVIWDEGQGAGHRVLGQILGDTGTPAFEISGFSGDTDPEAAALLNGNWVVAMTSGSRIFTQLMDPSGAKIGSQTTTGIGTAIDPVVTGLADGGFALAYTNADGDDTVWVRTFNADGSARTVHSVPIGTGGINNEAAVAGLPNGNFAVVYDDTGWGTPGLSLNIVSPNGTNLTGPIRIDTDAFPNEEDVDVAVLPNGFIVATWTHPATPTDRDIYARVFTSNGTPVAIDGSTEPFVITASLTDSLEPSIAQIAQGIFVTSWTDTAPDRPISTKVNEIYVSLSGDAADDFMNGSALRDIFLGFEGVDTVIYASSPEAVYVNLSTNIGVGGNAQNDVYQDIENIVGSFFDDTLIGGPGANSLFGHDGTDFLVGGPGDDTLDGGLGADILFYDEGADHLIGGAGIDYATYANGPSQPAGTNTLRIDLVTQANNSGLALGDTFTDVEAFFLSQGDDLFSGDSGNNFVYGQNGNDAIAGAGGGDIIYGEGGNDFINSGALSDILVGGAGADTFYYSINQVEQDQILDFETGVDKIALEDTGFNLVGQTITAGFNFFVTTTALGASYAAGRSTLIFYSDVDQLYADTDGAGGNAANLLAVFGNNPSLTAGDFAIL